MELQRHHLDPAIPASLEEAARHVLSDILCLREDESLLVLAEYETLGVAGEFLSLAGAPCNDVVLVALPKGAGSQLHVPDDLAGMLAQRSAFLALTMRGFTHTRARKEACKKGSRGLSMPGATADLLMSGAVRANYRAISAATQRLAAHLNGTDAIVVRSEAGTNLEFDVSGGIWFAEKGLCDSPGDFGNLPGGEVSIAPVDANGDLVVDGSINPLGLLKSPLRITIRDRRIADIRGDRADELASYLDAFGPGARNVAEIAFGANPGADITGVTVKDEKALGTIHVGFGNNSNMGGYSRASKVDVPVHIDAVLRPKISVLADSRPIDVHEYF